MHNLLHKVQPWYGDPLFPAHEGTSALFAIAEDIRVSNSAEHFGCDGAQLLRKLATLSRFAQIALVEACERFWRDHAASETAAGLRAVGLIPPAATQSNTNV